MGVFKNDKEIIKIIASFLVEMYRSTPKKVHVPYVSPVVPSTVAPGLSLILLQNFFNLVPFITYSVIGVSAILMFKDLFDSRPKSVELQPENKNPKNLPPFTLFPKELPKKRVLSLHLCSPYSTGQYVIFKQKNKNNMSSIQVERGEIGKIIERVDNWDKALVDFSIQVPLRFKNWNTKLLTENAYNEAVLIVEKIKTEKELLDFSSINYYFLRLLKKIVIIAPNTSL